MPLGEIHIETRAPAHAAVVRRKAAQGELAQTFGECFGTVFGTLGQKGVAPLSAPFARYTVLGDVLEFEAGVMVAEPFAADGEVAGITIPGGEVATAIYTGPYDDLRAAGEQFMGWIASRGRVMNGPPLEEYINDPGELPPSEWQTKMSFPIR